MDVNWPMITALVAVVSAAAGVVSYVVRTEVKSVRELVVLDKEAVRLRLATVEEQLVKVQNVLVILADYKGQLRILEERLLAQGQRLDDLVRRFNDLHDKWDMWKGKGAE